MQIIQRPWFWLKENVWNNSFAYFEWKKIWIPWVKIWSIENLELWNEVVFADLEDWKYKESVWLKDHLWIINSAYQNKILDKLERYESNNNHPPIFICDNHNYALEAWKYFKNEKPLLIHIDQHRDEAFPLNIKKSSLVWKTSLNYLIQTRVCDYINWAKDNNWIQKSHISLCESKDFNNLSISDLIQNKFSPPFEKGVKNKKDNNFILNIDLDIFAPEQTIISYDQIWSLIFGLAKNACLITIATSPLFIDQKKAIELVRHFLSHFWFK